MGAVALVNRRGFAVVDDADLARAGQYRWCLHSGGYAFTRVDSAVKRLTVYMHRFLLDAPAGVEVDHVNRNKLDNRRANLRLASHSQNEASKPSTGASGYRGVYRERNHWRAIVYKDTRPVEVGCYATSEAAARAYDIVARRVHGAFAFQNFPGAR